MISYFNKNRKGSILMMLAQYCNISTQVLNNLFILKVRIRHVSVFVFGLFKHIMIFTY
jgi:hypothetical protein